MKHFYERHLPHYVVEGYAYFITVRLHGSLPKSVIDNLKQTYDRRVELISSIKNKRKMHEEYLALKWEYFTEFDLALHSHRNMSGWLSIEIIAQLVKDALHYRDNKDFNLIAYTIMSNHVHMVIFPFLNKIASESEYKNKYPLGGLMASFKKYTALKANKILNRSGAFWQHESYDHVVRDNKELFRIVKYVLNNPVKAELVEDYNKYKWNYYNPKYL